MRFFSGANCGDQTIFGVRYPAEVAKEAMARPIAGMQVFGFCGGENPVGLIWSK